MLRRPLPPAPPVPSRHGGWHAASGFTLVELIVVMLLMAVVATVGLGRFADRQPFAVQSLADQLVSGVRIAQSTAMAQRRDVYVKLTASPPALAVCLDAGCSQPIAPPGGDGQWLTETQELQFSSGHVFSFAASGSPSFAVTLSVQVQDAGGVAGPRTVTIEPVSGHVRVQ